MRLLLLALGLPIVAAPFDRALFEAPAGFYHTNRWDRALVKRAAFAWQQVQTQMRHYFGLN